MKKRHIVILCAAAVLFSVVSCKSTPETTPAAPPAETPAAAPAAPAAPGGPSQASLDALNQAKARADAARKRAADFDSAVYFPSDWEGAESQYESAGKLSPRTDDEVRQAAAQYTTLAGTYDGIFTRAIPLYAQDREDELVAARDTAIGTGLSDTFPDYLLDADRVVALALEQYEGEDYYAAKDSWTLARDKYQALKAGGDAYNRRLEIVERGFVSYDRDNFNKADEIGLAAVDQYEAGNVADALNGAEEAGLRYSLALKTAWAAYAAERRTAAGTERQKALDFKANVAVKADFDTASGIYNQAESSVQSEEFEHAAALYMQSEARFTVIAQTAAEKRREAEDAIRQAEEKMRESEENARKAEEILEGGAS
jgi:hypothetical protein